MVDWINKQKNYPKRSVTFRSPWRVIRNWASGVWSPFSGQPDLVPKIAHRVHHIRTLRPIKVVQGTQRFVHTFQFLLQFRRFVLIRVLIWRPFLVIIHTRPLVLQSSSPVLLNRALHFVHLSGSSVIQS
jgi:hypothetical protein